VTSTGAFVRLRGPEIVDNRTGTDFDDHLVGGNTNDRTLMGGGGNDRLGGLGAQDTIQGQDGYDLVFGDDEYDTLLGGLGDDEYIGGSWADTATLKDSPAALEIDASLWATRVATACSAAAPTSASVVRQGCLQRHRDQVQLRDEAKARPKSPQTRGGDTSADLTTKAASIHPRDPVVVLCS
jgi:hypothetical protein